MILSANVMFYVDPPMDLLYLTVLQIYRIVILHSFTGDELKDKYLDRPELLS